MLEVIHLSKVYRPKKGQPVKALDDVSLRFPDRGMVFLLGKSGSGKSTLLNLLGGLDRYDSGDIRIHGVSSQKFTQQYFDSYRNTYVGFIFQEYNILDEFTVGANIGLALELQGKKAADEEINRILKEVDLEGYGDRRPNELSGGQKQRVAIARALVKNPEIIMADEPTGALDSATGRQVLDTLRKLSANHLVIIVSHDREFAEQYADRIIELADGHIIDDVTHKAEAEMPQASEGLTYEGDQIRIPAAYHLTEEDRLAINAYMDRIRQGLVLTEDTKAAGGRFVKSEEADIITEKKEFHLIRSKLPMKDAFKIGASSLKVKKFRLAVTVLLSVTAFGLFALADTMASYNHVQTCTSSLIDSGISYVSPRKEELLKDEQGNDYTRRASYLTEQDLLQFKENTGVELKSVYVPQISVSYGTYAAENKENTRDNAKDNAKDKLCSRYFRGFAVMKPEELNTYHFTMAAGQLPDEKGELALTAYQADVFVEKGYQETPDAAAVPIAGYEALLGRKLTIGGSEYQICGVVDTGFHWDRYERLLSDEEISGNEEMVIQYFLTQEFYYEERSSMNNVGFVTEDSLAQIRKDTFGFLRRGAYSILVNSQDNGKTDTWISCWADTIGKLQDIDPDLITWLDGKEHTKLEEGEIILPAWEVEEESLSSDTLLELNLYPEQGGTMVDYYKGCRVVGVIDTEVSCVILPDAAVGQIVPDYDRPVSDMAVGAMPEGREDVYKLVNYCYSEESKVQYPLQSQVTFELDTINNVLKMVSRVFIYIGIGFAVFAGLLLSNFISVSISYKKQEIGILRAIGARSSDVFRIFFSESFIIAMINFVLAAAASGAAIGAINKVIRENGVLVTVLNYGPRQIALIFLVSLFVAAAASFLPVWRIASKRPIDAIRDR